MKEVFIALGSNSGNREENIFAAVKAMQNILSEIQLSGLYETDAHAMEEGHAFPFINAVLRAKTEISAKDLLIKLLEIEKDLGRERKKSTAYLSRPIDLDILLFNNEIIKEEGLEIPHPRMLERVFVLKPLIEIAPEVKIPETGIKAIDFYHRLFKKKSEFYLD